MIIIIFLIKTSFQNCIWQDEDNKKYDLSLLDRNGGWHVSDEQNGMGMFNMVYIFNFCKIDLHCNQTQVAVYESLEIMGTLTENCDIVGLQNNRMMKKLDQGNGIQVQFNDGSYCTEIVNNGKQAQVSKPRSGTFNIICSKKADQNFRITNAYGCSTIFEIHHPMGCGDYTGESQAKTILAYLFTTFFVYIILGILYNKFVRKEMGIVIPHIEFWRDFPKLVIDGIKYLQYRFRNRDSGYSVV